MLIAYMKLILLVFPFILLLLCGCEDIVLKPDTPPSKDPKDYLWSGDLESIYVYRITRTLRDSAGRDSTYFEPEVTKKINVVSRILSGERRAVTMETTTSKKDTTFYYELNNVLYASRNSVTDSSSDTLLAGNLQKDSLIQNLPYSYQKAKVISVGETDNVPAGSFNVVKTTQSIDSGEAIILFPGMNVISNGNSIMKTSYAPGNYIIRQEVTTQFPPPYRTRWRSITYTTELRTIQKK
jgi:hypothetical protein